MNPNWKWSLLKGRDPDSAAANFRFKGDFKIPVEDVGIISVVNRSILEAQSLSECQHMIILAAFVTFIDAINGLWVPLERNFTFYAIIELI